MVISLWNRDKKKMKLPKIIYKDENVAFVHAIPNGVEYWQFWLHKPAFVYVFDSDGDRITAIYRRVPVVTNQMGAERYYPDRRYWEQYEPLQKIKLDEVLEAVMTTDLLCNINHTYTKRLRGKMTAQQLVESLDNELWDVSVYDLPILFEHLYRFYLDPQCQHIYQYFVVRAYIRRGACSVKTIAQLFDMPYQEVYQACKKLEGKGCVEPELRINPESKASETDWFIIKEDLAKYWKAMSKLKPPPLQSL